MVKNHSTKSLARRLMAESKGKLSYGEAKILAESRKADEAVSPGYSLIRGGTATGTTKLPLSGNYRIVKLTEGILINAIEAGAETVIFEAKGLRLQADYSVDNVHHEESISLDPDEILEALSRLKSLAGIDLDSDRVQKGHFSMVRDGEQVDLYATSLPDFLWGGSVLIRIEAKTEPLSETPLSERETLELTRDFYRDRAKLSTADLRSIDTAISNLRQGRDVVVFGGTSSGKTTLAERIIEGSSLRSWIFLSRAQYPRGTEPLDSSPVGTAQFLRRQLKDTQLIAVDELEHGKDHSALEPVLEAAYSKLIVIHANSAKDAEASVRRMLPELTLRNTLFLEAVYSDGVRSAQIAEDLAMSVKDVIRNSSGKFLVGEIRIGEVADGAARALDEPEDIN